MCQVDETSCNSSTMEGQGYHLLSFLNSKVLRGQCSTNESFLTTSLGHLCPVVLASSSFHVYRYSWLQECLPEWHPPRSIPGKSKNSSQSRKLLTAEFPRLILQTDHKKETADVNRCPGCFLIENPSV